MLLPSCGSRWAAEPVRLCDDPYVWDERQSELRAERTMRLKQLLVDLFDGEQPDFAPYTKWEDNLSAAGRTSAEALHSRRVRTAPRP